VKTKSNQGLLLFGGGLLLLLLLVGSVVPGIPGFGTPASASECDGVTIESPAVGNDCNEDPVSPEEFQDWEDVYRFGADNQNQWYFDCLQTRIGVSREDVRRYAELERQGHVLTGILVSNTNATLEEARAKLKGDGVDDVDRLTEMRKWNGFENTRGIGSNRCSPFGDGKPQIRLILLVPLDVDDVNKGFHQDRGVLGMCGNPAKLTPEPVPPPPPPRRDNPTTTTTPRVTTTTVPGPTTTTTVPSTTTTTVPCPVESGVQTIRGEDGVCYKPERAHDTDGAGGDESNGAQPHGENPPDELEGVDTDDSPPAEDREQGDPDGGSGNAGVPDDGPVDNTHEDDHTGPDNGGNDDTSTPPCPFGAGNC
jgi:hypothetical protein